MSLTRIQVKGFKSFRELDFELRDLNVLIGANGAGKSNFLGVFQLAHEVVNGRIETFSAQVGANALLYMGLKTTDRIYSDFYFEKYHYRSLLAPGAQDNLIIQSDVININGENLLARPRLFDKSVMGLNQLKDWEYEDFEQLKPIQEEIGLVIDTWRVYHFLDTTREARIKQSHNINDNAFLRSDGSNLAAFLYLLRERQHAYYDRIVKTIRLIAPFFDDFVLRPNPLNEENIRLEWRERGSDEYQNAHMLSDGTLRFICLATLLLQPQLPSLILIDEPELGLHPYAITHLAGLLRSASKLTQVIVSTQSPSLVSQFETDDIVMVEREQRQTILRRLDEDALKDWLDEYTLGELWEKNVLGGRPQHWEPTP